MAYKTYTVLHNDGNCSYVGTWESSDGVERVVLMETAYCSVHGRMAAIGSQWEYAVEGKDDYCSTWAQTWVPSLEEVGDEFRRADYAVVLSGRQSFLSLPDLAHAYPPHRPSPGDRSPLQGE